MVVSLVTLVSLVTGGGGLVVTSVSQRLEIIIKPPRTNTGKFPGFYLLHVRFTFLVTLLGIIYIRHRRRHRRHQFALR